MRKTQILLLAAALGASACAAPFVYEGRWLRNGHPQKDADTTCTVSFYESDGGAASATLAGVPFKTDSDGYFVVSTNAPAMANDVFWVGLAPQGAGEIEPRFRVAPVPFALAAAEAALVKSDSAISVTGTASIDRLETSGDVEVENWTIPSGGTVKMKNAQFDRVRLTQLAFAPGDTIRLYDALGAALTPDYDAFPQEITVRTEVNVYTSGIGGFYLNAKTTEQSDEASYTADGFLVLALRGEPKKCPAPRVSVKVGTEQILDDWQLGSDKGGVVKRCMTVPYRNGEKIVVKVKAVGYEDSVDSWWGGDKDDYRGSVGVKMRLVRFGVK